MGNQQHDAAVDASPSSKRAFEYLETFAERSRRSDEQTTLIAGMPALLERGIMYFVGVAVVATLLILYFGRAQAIVETKGKILPQGNVIPLQAAQGGIVREVKASLGDSLPAGALVVRIDSSEANLTVAQLRNQRAADDEQLHVLRASLARLERVLASPEQPADDGGTALAASTHQNLNGLEQARIQLDAATQEQELVPERRRQLEDESTLTKDRIALLERTHTANKQALAAEEAALVSKREERDSVRKLADRKLLSVLELNQSEERYRAAEMSLLNLRQRVDQIEVDASNARLKLTELRTSLHALESDSRAKVRQAQAQYRQALVNLRQERESVQIQARALESKVAQADRQLSIGEGQLELASVTMPVAGTIAELKVRTAGEIVSAGSVIATIVPTGVPLIVEATATNQDVGFIHAGLDARVKVDAFPYQQFGTARARVLRMLPAVGNNASFVVQLELLDQKLSLGGTDYNLFPGLSVQADLITGRQRLLDILMQGQKDSQGSGAQ